MPDVLFRQLQSLKILSLEGNQFHGIVHGYIFQVIFSLHINFTGSISPALFSMLPNLVEVWLSNNQISGPLPYETFGDCLSLTHIGMMNNKISGDFSEHQYI